MTITVGTDTYISLADAQSYAAAQGLTLGANDTATETLLKRATTALDRLYGNKYLGIKQVETQALAWPRFYISSQNNMPHGQGEWLYQTYDSDGNPRDFTGIQPETGYAEVELAALIQSGTDVYAQPLPAIVFERSKVGSLEKEIHTTDNRSYMVNPLYKISLILRPLLTNSTGAIPITRGA